MGLETFSSDFDLLASSTSHHFRRASLTVIGLLHDLERWATATIGTLNNSELALIEDVLFVIGV